MQAYSTPTKDTSEADARSTNLAGTSSLGVKIGLLTGGFDKPYVYGLATALAAKGAFIDLVGGDAVDCPEFHTSMHVNFLNFRHKPSKDEGLIRKVTSVLSFYARLIQYAAVSKAKILHIIWNNKIYFLDRTLLMLYYKMLGKKLVFTAHNINAGVRDSSDSFVNRLTLKTQYRLADHIFVHTEKMKGELIKDFGIRESAITVIPFGINNAVPDTDLTPRDARRRLGISEGEKTLLFFGNIGTYKGLEYLVAAFQEVLKSIPDSRLIIAGKLRGDAQKYANEIFETIDRDIKPGRVLRRIEFVPDEETEIYFKAADAFVLPYKFVAQSGVLCLGYSFGVPAIATDVGSLREDIVEGETGFLCRPCDSASLASTIERYFHSDLYQNVESRRLHIRAYANEHHSWDVVAERTLNVYMQLLGNPST